MNGVNYYQLFSLPSTATDQELRAQYRKLSLNYHPDRGGSTDQMAALNEAYRVLSNPLLRREYDQKQAQLEATHDEYHYHVSPRPARPAYAHAATDSSPSHFWRWFAILTVLGMALITYDVTMTWVMPHYVVESSVRASSDNFTPSGDLTDEAASALSEFQSLPPSNQRVQR